MKNLKILRIRYSPGYSDMLGGSHSMLLAQDESGAWRMAGRDCEAHNMPTVVAVYAVTDEAVAQLAEFIRKHRVLKLEQRPKSDLFATDYSPWSFYIDWEQTLFGKTAQKSCGFGEYKNYSTRDYGVIKALRERFTALRGEKLSESEEER